MDLAPFARMSVGRTPKRVKHTTTPKVQNSRVKDTLKSQAVMKVLKQLASRRKHNETNLTDQDDPVSLSAFTEPTSKPPRRRFNEDDDEDEAESSGISMKQSSNGQESIVLNTEDVTESKRSFLDALDGKSPMVEGEEEKTQMNDEEEQDNLQANAMQDVDLTLDTNASTLNAANGIGTPMSGSYYPAQSPQTNPASPMRSGLETPMSSSMFASPKRQGVDSPMSASSTPVPKSSSSPVKPAKRQFDELEHAANNANLAQRNKATEPSVFWAAHREWLRSIPKISFVTVDEPLQMPRTLTNPNPPYTYLVRTNLCAEGVRRRYSDFELLRIYLASRYPGILILALPEKKAVGNSNVEFLKERAKGLDAFLKVLLENDYLRADGFVNAFLVSSPTEWETAKKRASVPTTPIPGPNSNSATDNSRTPLQSPAQQNQANSEERWRAAVQMAILPEKYEEEVRKTSETLARLELGLKNLVATANKCVAVSQQYASAIKDLHRQFAFTLASVQSPMEFWSDAASLEPILMEELLLEALSKELELIAEMRRMIEQRRELVVSADQKLAVLHKYEDERQQNEKTGQQDRALRSAQKVQDAQKQVKQADYRQEMVTKALFLGGLASFVPARTAAISALLGRFAFGELRFGDLMKSVWLGVVASLRLDLTQIEADSAQSMETVRRRVPDKFKAMFMASANPTPSPGSQSPKLGNGTREAISAGQDISTDGAALTSSGPMTV